MAKLDDLIEDCLQKIVSYKKLIIIDFGEHKPAAAELKKKWKLRHPAHLLI